MEKFNFGQLGVRLFYIQYNLYVVFIENDKPHTRRAKIIDEKNKICEFRYKNQKIQKEYHW